jgi:hypothetical protein
MVRFEGGTGTLKNDPLAVLVLYPGGEEGFRGTTSPWKEFRADEEPEGSRFVARVQGDPTLPLDDRWRLLGDQSGDTILTKGVCELALYNEKRLAAWLGARIDGGTGCIYQYFGQPALRHPAFVAGVSAASPPNSDRVNYWIEGFDPTASPPGIDTDCRLFTVQRYLGTLQEITGTRNGGGVAP